MYTATDDSNALGAPGGAGGGGSDSGRDDVVVLSIDVGETTFTLPVQRSADYTHVAEKFCAQTGEMAALDTTHFNLRTPNNPSKYDTPHHTL